MDGGLSKNDPYRGMSSGEDGIRPEFLAASDKAAEELRASETAAGDKVPEKPESGIDDARKGEAEAKGLYRGQGRKAEAGRKKAGLKGTLKKRGPMGLVIGLIVAVGGMMMGAQTLMPVAISELIIEKLNSVGISSTTASDVWLDTQLNQASGEVSTKAGDVSEAIFGISEFQVQSFESQGLKVVKSPSDSSKVLAIMYQKNGSYIPVVGSKLLGNGNLLNTIKTASGLSNVSVPVSAEKAFLDKEFKNPYTTASKTWRGGNSGWFDKIMSSITETKLSVTRNRWARFAATTISNLDDEFKKVAASAAKTQTSDGGLNKSGDYYNEVSSPWDWLKCWFNSNWCHTDTGQIGSVAEESTEVMQAIDNGSMEPRAPDGASHDTEATLSSSVREPGQVESILTSRAMKAAAQISNVTCAVVEGMMSIYTLVSAFQNMQFLNLVSGFLESVDKMKAGDGDESAIHEYGNNLTTVGETRDNAGNLVANNKTAMSSAGMAWLFNDDEVISSDDASVRNVNMETMMSSLGAIASNIELAAKAYEMCGYAKAASAVVSLATTVFSFIPIVGGGIKAAQITVSAFAKAAISAAVVAIFYAAIPVIAKKVANTIISDAATEWFGEDLGNALISGANKYLGGNGTSGGQSPGGEREVMAYLGVRDTVIAEEAEYQRSIRSPFDITSEHTFLGSLAYSLIPLAVSSGSVVSVLKSTSSLTSSSLVALLPTASAIDKQDVLNSKGDCALLDGIDIVGDAFCNAYVITDTSTMTTAPMVAYKDVYYLKGYYMHYWHDEEDVYHSRRETYSPNYGSNGHVQVPSRISFNADGSMYKPHLTEDDGWEFYSDNLTEAGAIISGSNLDKYVGFCGQRTSQYGIKDAAIAEKLSGADSTASKIIGFIPGLSDVQTIYQSLREERNMAWATGEACVASSSSPYWGENKFYQRYSEDQRLLESTNPEYKSAVTVAAESYYTENPVDDSFEGQLARFSGMSKEQVEDTLALLEYYQFLEQYDASSRYAFTEPVVEQEQEIFFDGGDAVTTALEAVIPEKIVYADLRGRTAVV